MESELLAIPDADKADDSAATGRALLLAGGLLGTCIVFLSSLLSLPHLDAWLTVALYALVIAMPCLGFFIAITTAKMRPTDIPDDVRGFFVRVLNSAQGQPSKVTANVGAIAAIAGIIAVVGHLSIPAFLILVATVVIIVVLFWRAFTAARKSLS